MRCWSHWYFWRFDLFIIPSSDNNYGSLPTSDWVCTGYRQSVYSLSKHLYQYRFVWRKHENMCPCTGSGVNTDYERIASWCGYQCWTRDRESYIHLSPPAVAASVLTTRPWPICQKTDWHQLSGITHWLQHRVDFGQGRFSTRMLAPGTGI